MDYKKYEELLNRVMKKCPLESGVQTLVFMYLDELFENCTKYEPVIIDRETKSKIITINKIKQTIESCFNTKGGIPDIALVGKNFDYDESYTPQFKRTKDKVLFCIEVKLPKERNADKKHSKKKGEIKKIDNIDDIPCRIQFLWQLLTFGEGILTNGKKWEYCKLKATDKECNDVEKKILEYGNKKNSVSRLNKSDKSKIKKLDKTRDAEKIKKLKELINNRKKQVIDYANDIFNEPCVKTMFDNPEFSCEVAKYNDVGKLIVDEKEFRSLTDHINGLIQELNA